MFRGILRNVQFYLLLSSGLLALLAFQHLNWYDQGIFSYANTLIDKPSYGSPDESTHGKLYYGNEAKAIGIFKFKVGLFKFALPTFSNEAEAWEREDHLRVPVPRTRKRKRSASRVSRKELVRKESLRVRQNFGDNSKHSSKASVVYSLVIPPHDQMNQSLRDRAAVLAASIRRAHTNSPYKHSLYAINFEHLSDYSTEKVYTCSRACRKVMTELGFQIVDVSASHLDKAVSGFHDNMNSIIINNNNTENERINSHNDRSTSNPPSMNDLLNHDIIVHISLDSFLLQALDSVFDDILREEHDYPSNNLQRKKTTQDTNFFNLRTKSKEVTHSSSEDSFTAHQLYILKMRSSGEIIAYLKMLKCLASAQLSKIDLQLSIKSDRRIESSVIMPITVRPNIRSLLSSGVQRANRTANQFEANDRHCKILNNSTVLDNCIYAAGSHQQCSHVDIKKSAVIASFFPGDTDDKSRCAKPWECQLNEHGQCIHPRGDGSEDVDCEWLQREWFRLAKPS